MLIYCVQINTLKIRQCK